MADMAIPRYVAIAADIPGLLASAVDFPAEGETETAALASGNNITDIIGKVLGNIAFSAGNGNIAKLDINPGGLLTALGLDEGTKIPSALSSATPIMKVRWAECLWR